MKRISKLLSAALLLLSAFQLSAQDPKYYGEFKISPQDNSVTIEKNVITIAPKKEAVQYEITGYFNGQIVNKTKNTILKLNNAYIENTDGQPAIYGEAKTEISAKEDSVNYIISSGTSANKNAALHCKKNLEIGGKGTLYIQGKTYHGVKADDVKIKGTGKFYFEGTKKGSCINCKTFTVEKGKTFTAYLSNAKNAIKADETIFIDSGNFEISGNSTVFKTDTKEDDPSSPHGIRLSGGVFKTSKNGTLYDTDKNAYKASGAKITEK
ncbi:carbohydrate-binding domain-containing protein [Treponema sp.]|uniref:carbohydrate-binding domain-containing protein n=1 Tax=Treponema sp. TaxID=166 RepID=UPI0025CC59BD|nr:carbohydrate-binding domain-containing protein [Treponema sp.]MCR5218413.1 carbohydrate-binding domain-containing protein [Treponema sp.]